MWRIEKFEIVSQFPHIEWKVGCECHFFAFYEYVVCVVLLINITPSISFSKRLFENSCRIHPKKYGDKKKENNDAKGAAKKNYAKQTRGRKRSFSVVSYRHYYFLSLFRNSLVLFFFCTFFLYFISSNI